MQENDSATTTMTASEARDFLCQCGIPASAQRLAIFLYLRKYRNHPSVDQIYNALKPELPSLSRTTVYNTLQLFCERGAAQYVPTADGSEMHFDGDTHEHAHFRCKKCGKIFDLLNTKLPHPTLPQGFRIHSSQILITGSCADCE